jgi:hypothetical protein
VSLAAAAVHRAVAAGLSARIRPPSRRRWFERLLLLLLLLEEQDRALLGTTLLHILWQMLCCHRCLQLGQAHGTAARIDDASADSRRARRRSSPRVAEATKRLRLRGKHFKLSGHRDQC